MKARLAMVIVVAAAVAGCGGHGGYPQTQGGSHRPNYGSNDPSYRAGYDYLAYHQKGSEPVGACFSAFRGSGEGAAHEWRQGCTDAGGDYDIIPGGGLAP